MYEEENDNIIRRLRKKAMLTLRELSDAIHCTENHLTKIEAGKVNASMKLKIGIANRLDVTLTELLGAEILWSDEDYRWVRNMGTELAYDIVRCVFNLKIRIRLMQAEAAPGKFGAVKPQQMEEDVNYSLAAANIEMLRDMRHKTRRGVAEEIGVAEGTYRNIENNTNHASSETYAGIAGTLDTCVDRFFADSLKNKTEATRSLLHDIFTDASEGEQNMYKCAIIALENIFLKESEFKMEE